MSRHWHTFIHLLRLIRIEQVLAVMCSAWLVVILAWDLESRAGRNPDLIAWGRPVGLLLAGLIAGGMTVFGVALNDVLDVRHDRAFSPTRPLPAGRVSLTAAVCLAVFSLLTAVAAAACVGSVSMWLCVVAAVATVFYNTTAKFFPVIGVVLLGLLWALVMFIPNPRMTFAWPVWLTMTHVMVCSVAGHFLEGKRPRLGAVDAYGLIAGWAFWTMALVGWMSWARGHDGGGMLQWHSRPWMWAGPMLAGAAFVVLSARMMSSRMRPPSVRRAAGATFMRWSILWLIVYDAAWLAGLGLYGSAAAMAAVFAVGTALVRLTDVLEDLPVDLSVYRLRVGARDGPGA